jgi:two-component system, OmpR family, sensor histidine kinase KdpD
MKIRSFFSSQVFQYFVAICLIVLTTVVFFVLRDVLDTTLVALLFLLPVGLNTLLWGLGAGIASALFAFLTFNYFFIRPYYTLTVHQPIDLVILFVFLVVAVVISQLVGRAQAGRAVATAREREATQLYELSMVLSGLKNEKDIGNILAERIYSLFGGDCVEVHVESDQPIKILFPEKALPLHTPELTVLIEAAHGSMGEIRLWRDKPAIISVEKRLIHTFASQGALALERARLAQAESRAKILEESDSLKSAILSSVSHELRTPLATIKASVTSLLSGEVGWDSSARNELLAAINDEADHLDMVVGNLLDMSRIEAGVLKPKREWNILSEIVGSVLTRMHGLTDGYKLAIDLPEDLPLVPIDYVQIGQVFTNLLSNSAKYAPEGTLIRVHAHIQDDSIQVQVCNQGPKVPEEHLERIFDKFYRVTDADRVKGTGLGLSICKGIIEAHGGRIWGENLKDGFAFNFTLPLTQDGVPPYRLPSELEGE